MSLWRNNGAIMTSCVRGDVVCICRVIIYSHQMPNTYRHNIKFLPSQVGVIQGTKLALKYMAVSEGGKGGVIVNLASMAGRLSCDVSTCHYNPSRVGLIHCGRGKIAPIIKNILKLIFVNKNHCILIESITRNNDVLVHWRIYASISRCDSCPLLALRWGHSG